MQTKEIAELYSNLRSNLDSAIEKFKEENAHIEKYSLLFNVMKITRFLFEKHGANFLLELHKHDRKRCLCDTLEIIPPNVFYRIRNLEGKETS